MDTAQSNLFVWYKLEVGFFRGNVRHKICGGGRKWEWKGAEDWSNCLRLGKGDFGVVYKQIQETTGHSREGKVSYKKLLSKFDYPREHLVLAILAKVCVIVPEALRPSLLLILTCFVAA